MLQQKCQESTGFFSKKLQDGFSSGLELPLSLIHIYFILRIEDTDQERYVEGAVDIIYRTMEKTGLIHDEGPVSYTHLDVYKRQMQQ